MASGKVLYFGRLSDAAGGMEAPMPAFEGAVNAEALIDLLDAATPGLAAALRAPEVRICVNLVIQPKQARIDIHPGDEVAFLPPMSGG